MLIRTSIVQHHDPSHMKFKIKAAQNVNLSINPIFLGDPDWLSEMQYNTISPLFVDY